jgi:hypothetical protein
MVVATAVQSRWSTGSVRRAVFQAPFAHRTTRSNGVARPASPAATSPPVATAPVAIAKYPTVAAPGASSSLRNKPVTTKIGSASFVTRSHAFDTTTNRTNSKGWCPQVRTIVRLIAVAAIVPKGSSLVTALPERLSTSARRRVSPGIDAASATVWTTWPTSQTAASATSQIQDRPRMECHAADHDAPSADRRRAAHAATATVTSTSPTRRLRVPRMSKLTTGPARSDPRPRPL